MMRAPIAYRRSVADHGTARRGAWLPVARRTTTPPNIVPRLAPEVYAGRIFPTGRGGTVTVEDDGTGTVRDELGRYRTTLPAHTVREVVTAATK